MPYEPVLPDTDLVRCAICKAEGMPFTMAAEDAWYHDRTFHPELAQPEVLQEAQAS